MKNRIMALTAAAAAALAACAAGPARAQQGLSPGLGPPVARALHWTTVEQQITTLAFQISMALAQQQAQQVQAQQAQTQALLQAQQAMVASSNQMAQSVMSLANSLRANEASLVGDMQATVSAVRMSCPVFAGAGTLLGESGCVWATAVGTRTDQSGLASDSAGLLVGGQREIAPGWFLGGSLGIGSSWMQQGGVASLGRSFSGGVVVKRVQGPWLLAGVAAAGTTATHLTRAAPGGGTMQADANVFQGGLRLRAAYDLAFAGWYLRPRLDLDAYYSSTGGLQEYGPSPAALSVSGTQKTRAAIVPALEVGGRVAAGSLLGDGTILRPYLIGGVAVLPDNNVTLYTGFQGALASFGGFQTVFVGPPLLGTLEAGLQLYREKGLEMRAEYRLAGGQSYFSQGLALRGAWHF